MVQVIHAMGVTVHPILENGENWMDALVKKICVK